MLARLGSDLSWLLPADLSDSIKRRTGSLAEWRKACEPYSLKKMEVTVPDAAPLEVAAIRLVASIVAKYVPEGERGSCREAALENLREAEKVCSAFNTRKYTILESSPYLPLMREFISRTIGDLLPDTEQLWKSARHGPGAVCGQVMPKSYSKYFKYSEWPYSVTPRARKYAVEFIRNDPRWWGALEASYRGRFGLMPWALLDVEAFWDNTLVNVPGNRVTTVPKDDQKDRPIAIEPTLNLMLQLGVDGFIRKRLKKRWGIDLDNQERNQELARAGSVCPFSVRPATIDLSMASDTVSLRCVKMLLPKQWYEYLCDIRSPSGVLPDGSRLRYSKLSSMGNGATFAIESLIFSAVLFAVAKHARWKWSDQFSVYGDDIIVPQVLAPDVIHLLRMSGFSVNEDKSFFDASVIRESCGTDWYRAYPVRGVFLKEKPSDIMGLFHAHNALWLWSTIHGVSLSNTLAYLRSIIESFGFGDFLGPPDPECTDQYIFDPGSTSIKGVAKQLNHKKPKDFLWGKLLASLSSHSDSHQWSPFRDIIGAGSVFTSAGRTDWHYVTYTKAASSALGEVRDAAREFFSYSPGG
jgi:hypothetical protein